MRYVSGEVPVLVGFFSTGSDVTIDILRLSDNTKIVDGESCTEIEGTGSFRYEFHPDEGYAEYLWIMSDGLNSVAGSFVIDGYPAAIPTVAEIDDQLSGSHGSGAWGAIETTEHHAPSNDDPILDDNGNPVQGASIYAYSDRDYETLIAKATTDVNGLWDLYFQTAGTYYIRCVMSGYEDMEWVEEVT